MGVLSASLNTAQTIISETNAAIPLATAGTFTATTESPLLLAGRSHLKELAWLIPLAIGGIIAMVFIALLCFYGVTALERKLAVFCFTTCGCCRPGPNSIGDESESLSRAYHMKETHGELNVPNQVT
ncbi:hypothetical protein ElyMa_002019000 [Elysia marginata]|uniref:Uncharacterized protein n=1 Tax=Elysia marginata TaxID=1093978 RepID=A0AAV4F517_9GAST|nr:hypothetical protein ElyMa_002019000 [Elysia marginata]